LIRFRKSGPPDGVGIILLKKKTNKNQLFKRRHTMRNIMERSNGNVGLKAVMLKRRAQVKRIGTSALMRLSRLRSLQDDLDLSDEQVQKLWEIESTLVRNVAKLTVEIRVARFESVKAIAARSANFDQIRAHAKKAMELRLQRKLALIDAYKEGLEVLTPDQREELSGCISVWAEEVDEESEDDQE
jgi:hypothetical protein